MIRGITKDFVNSEFLQERQEDVMSNTIVGQGNVDSQLFGGGQNSQQIH
jgi:hypothetical protein